MSEFGVFDHNQYFADSGEVIRDISATVVDTLNSSHGVKLVLDLQKKEIIEASGLLSAEELEQANPDVIFDDVEEIARIMTETEKSRAWLTASSVVSMFHMEEVAKENARLQELELSEEERTEKLGELHLTQPKFAFWQKGTFRHTEDQNEVVMSNMDLYEDRNDAELASLVDFSISDGEIKKNYSFFFVDNKPVFTSGQTNIEHDELMERAANLLNLDDYATAHRVAGGLVSSEEEVAQTLSDVWLKYQGTSKEYEVGPLLDEIADRFRATENTLLMQTDIYTYPIPTLQELIELKTYLSQ